MRVELGFVSALKNARETNLECDSDDLLIRELSALVNDFLSCCHWLINMLLHDHCLDMGDCRCLHDLQLESLLASG